MLTCTRCGQVREPLPKAPLFGTLGQQVLSNVCAACWTEWQHESFRLLNHYGLEPVKSEDRKKLYVYLREFLKLPIGTQ